MLHLASPTPDSWIMSVQNELDVLLLDHAHCEKKAASTVLGLIFRYPEYSDMRSDTHITAVWIQTPKVQVEPPKVQGDKDLLQQRYGLMINRWALFQKYIMLYELFP